jgi:DNA invertase Pin-like site-specific DNA recombinase
MNHLKKAPIYVRVSTVEQETDLQQHELQEYCERRDWSCVVYRGKGQSGTKNDRPALIAMLNVDPRSESLRRREDARGYD